MLNYDNILIEKIYEIVSIYVENNLLKFYKSSFSKDLINHIKSTLDITKLDKKDFKYFMKHINKVFNNYYKNDMPCRSHKNNRSRKIPNLSKIYIIRNIPQPPQRTEAWYRFRYDLITASNAYKCLGTDAKKNEIICEKCKDFAMHSGGFQDLDGPLHWGVKYEPLSVMYYEYYYNTKVEDFGCIQHQKYKFLGASPDGINVDPSSNLYGRMLEIKNPKSREITGIPKDEYWVQMQLQMEVCDLNYCDFLETKFIEYKNSKDFYSDGSFNESKDGMYKGIFLHFVKDNNSYYFYPPFECGKRVFDKWEEDTLNLKDIEGYEWMQNIYWKLEKVSNILVLRNKPWLTKAIPEIEKTWNIIEKERLDKSWSNRMPKKNKEKLKKMKSFPTIINVDI
jgi:putative phage-type endonuclease